MTKPLPCPRCGAVAEPKSEREFNGIQYGRLFWRCECKNGHKWRKWYLDLEDAIKAWNASYGAEGRKCAS
jgi:hypothetical protein